MRRIVVIGRGFAALQAAQTLDNALQGRRHVQLTLLCDHAHFVYSPLLPHVVSGTIDVTDITISFEELLSDDATIRVASVEAIDPEGRSIRTDDGEVDYDYLLCAPDATIDWGASPADVSSALPFASPRDAVTARERLAELLGSAGDQTDEEIPHIAFAGGGRTGVELAAEMRRVADNVARESTDAESDTLLELTLFEKGDTLLPELPGTLSETCLNWLQSHAIEVETGKAVTHCREGELELAGGETIEADAIFWCAGWRPPEWLVGTGLPTDERGHLQVDRYLQVEEASGVFAAGITVSTDQYETRRVEVEAKQGETAARNLLANLSGRTPDRWAPDDPSWLVSLGANEALAYKNGTTLTGRAAWAFYRFVHTSLMPGALTKAGLLRSWIREQFA